ncbi:MAG: hypothetical protein WAM62_04285 [Pseudolabrys sp.]
MLRKRTVWTALALIFTSSVLFTTPTLAEFFGCNDHSKGRVLAYYTTPSSGTREFAAQTKRPRITIHPRRRYVGRNAVRQCEASLVKEYRVSGPVVVPRMHCWWQ